MNATLTAPDPLDYQDPYTPTTPEVYEGCEWVVRHAEVKTSGGKILFARDVVFPSFWDQNAINIVAEKYFYGKNDASFKEHDLRQLIDRVVDTIAASVFYRGKRAGVPGDVFARKLKTLLLHQKAFFNSPVNFNCGLWKYIEQGLIPKREAVNGFHYDGALLKVVPDRHVYRNPQVSACFILGLDDSMKSIVDTLAAEAMVFKGGSGAGKNNSRLRSSRETLSGGGFSSGPVSFMKGFDAFAGVVKSGGVNRRAAKIEILDMDHGDIRDFIWCKAKEEEKARVLIDSGRYPSDLDGEAYGSIFFQNSNISVRADDDFMTRAESNKSWELRSRDGKKVLETVNARELLMEVARSAWQCGDPGIQYSTTINNWHTCPANGPINSSNPCGEYLHLDDTSCNLASINLCKFHDAENDKFDVAGFMEAVKILIIAMDTLVDMASYPVERIAERSHQFRELGLGYCNLGSLLVRLGLPYDSDGGRFLAASITSLMTASGYKTSAMLADSGNDHGYANLVDNEAAMRQVLHSHRMAQLKLKNDFSADRCSYRTGAQIQEVVNTAGNVWSDVIANQTLPRNSQISVLAPTGTIGLAMSAETTGIEPMLAPVVYKRLVGGGMMKLVSDSIGLGLKELGYQPELVERIKNDLANGIPPEKTDIKPVHLQVFDTSFAPDGGTRFLSWESHVNMMAAVQAFISGGISKTVNLPASATPEDIFGIYLAGWKKGLKSVAVYRDGCKRSQPLNTKLSKVADTRKADPVARVVETVALPGPRARPAILPGHTFVVNANQYGKVYVTVNHDPESKHPEEVFIRESASNEAWELVGRLVSLLLRAGVPLKKVLKQLRRTEGNYVVRYNFPGDDRSHAFNSIAQAIAYGIERLGRSLAPPRKIETVTAEAEAEQIPRFGTFPCQNCGDNMLPNGNCLKCPNCGETSGCS